MDFVSSVLLGINSKKGGGGGGGSAQLDALIDRSITSVKSNAESIGDYAFYNCTNLTSVDLPEVTSVRQNAFSYCSGLTSISFPKATSLYSSAFSNCINLTSVDLPEVTSVGQGAFSNCNKLTSVDFSKVTFLGNTAFSNCKALNVLVLRTTTMCLLVSINAFMNTPFASGKAGGTLYVPQALISSYQSASNWSTILGYPNNQIKPIEGSIYEEV